MRCTPYSERPAYAHERQGFYLALRDEQPVKWVAMMKWKLGDHLSVLIGDPHEVDVVGLELRGEEDCEWLMKHQLAEADFDGHLPQAPHAQQALVSEVFDQGPGGRAEAPIAHDEPEEGVGIERQLHFT